MEVSRGKGALRKQKKADRDALTVDERQKHSHEICEALWRLPLIQEAQAVYCYAPIGSEADIWELAERLWEVGNVWLFRVYGATETETWNFLR